MSFPMKKTPLARALLVAGALAAAGGLAQAETYDSPQQAGEASTMTNGAPNLETTNSPYGHGNTVVITHPAVVAVSPAPVHQSWYYPAGVQTHVLGAGPAHDPHGSDVFSVRGSPETSNVPLRAGEASTMTGGAPNVSTNNFPAGSHSVTTVTTYGPYVYHGYSGPVYYYP